MPDLLVSIPDDTRELPADVLVPAARISDSTAAGRSVITAADAAAIRTAIGMTAAGSSVATAADAAAQRTALGMTAAGSAVVTAADAAAQLTALGAQPAADLDDDVAALAANPASALGAGLLSTFATVVNAGSNLSTARPAGAAVVYWKFSAGVDVGTSGVNIVNRAAGDLYFVADA